MTQDDRTLLEMAARAAGLRVASWADGGSMHLGTVVAIVDPSGDGRTYGWRPLTDDGDALRLAVKLRLEIGLSIDGCVYAFRRHSEGCHEPLGGTPESANAATRRAIVRAAAAIGEQSK